MKKTIIYRILMVMVLANVTFANAATTTPALKSVTTNLSGSATPNLITYKNNQYYIDGKLVADPYQKIKSTSKTYYPQYSAGSCTVIECDTGMTNCTINMSGNDSVYQCYQYAAMMNAP